jgi:transglutaminase-like putative cysteine protease
MSGRSRLALCAMSATLLAMVSLLPLARPMGWFGEATLLVVVQAGLGAAVRRAPLARPLAVAAQALVALLLLTLFFAPAQAVAGFLPTPAALVRLADLVSQGGHDVGQYAIPAPVTPGIRLLLVGGSLLVALAVDVLAVTYDSAASAGLPLLALYSVACGLDPDGRARWLWFLLAALGYLVLLLSEGRDRLSRWGRVFTGAPRRPSFGAAPQPVDGGRPVAATRNGLWIGTLALGVALILPTRLPALHGGLLAGANGEGLGRAGGTISAVNPLISLQDSLNQQDDRVVLRYRTTAADTSDLYLRIVTLDEFDGTSWKASTRKVANVPSELPAPQGLGPDVPATDVDTTLTAAAGYAQNYLPMPYPATKVSIGGDWRYEPVGRTLVGDRGQTTAGISYQVQSLQVDPTARQLADAPPAPAAIEDEYTKVPATLPSYVKHLAEQVTAGAGTQYEKAVKLQDWFTTTGGFTYDTKVASGSGPQAIVRFLHERRGFCVHFAFSMAAMARTLGIPARVDVGFIPGTEQDDGTWTVGLNDAHAWPELYFQGVGWTRFEPTPTRGFAPDYTLDTTGGGPGNDQPDPRLRPTARPSAVPSASPSCGQAQRRIADCGSGDGAAAGGPTGGDGPGPAAPAGGAAILALLLLAALPMLRRSRLRAVRLRGGRHLAPEAADAAVAAHVLACWRELRDTAWDYGLPPDPAETPRRATARLIDSAGLTGGTAEAARRIGDAVEQTLYARRPQPAPGLPDDLRLVTRALRDQATAPARVRARVAPRSTLHRFAVRCAAARSAVRHATARVTTAVSAAFSAALAAVLPAGRTRA